MKNEIIDAARGAFKTRLKTGNNISEQTRNAQKISKEWQRMVVELDSDNYQYNVRIAPLFDQQIDVLDSLDMCAYELKVSGKNATSEFYKDVVKILLWNRVNKKDIKELVFITEEIHGKRFLEGPMPKEYIKMLGEQSLNISIVYL